MTHTMDRAAVAAAIGYSEKHVVRLVADGKLTEVHGQLGGHGPRRALYDPAEVARIAAAGRTAPAAALLAADQTPAGSNGHAAAVHVKLGAVADTTRHVWPPKPPADQVLARFADLVLSVSEHLSRMSRTTSTPTFITMAAAAAELGLSEWKTRRLVKRLGLETQRTREGLKVRRSALPR